MGPAQAWAFDTGSALSYNQTFAAAMELEKSANFSEALALLEPLAQTYPQDYSLHLQLGWLAYNAGDYALAQSFYKVAVKLSEGSPQSLMGQGLCHLKRHQRASAIRAFRAVVSQSPNNRDAQNALRAAAALRDYLFAPSVSLGYVHYPQSLIGEKSFAASIGVGLNLKPSPKISFSADYRYAKFAFELDEQFVQSGSGRFQSDSGGSGRSYSYLGQSDLYLFAGYDADSYGARLHYGYSSSPGYTLEEAHVGGLTLRINHIGLGGPVVVHSNYSVYADARILRVAPGWKIPLTSQISVDVGGAMQQSDDGQNYGNLKLGITGGGKSWDAWFGGKYGDEFRPAYLDYSAIYNMTELIRWGAWAGVAIAVGDESFIKVAAEWSHLLDAADGSESEMYFISVGLGRRP